MLARPQRLTDARSFALVRRQGRACHHPLIMVTSRATGAPLTRVGFVVSKRVGGAVVRNTVKRRLRAGMRSLLPDVLPGYDVVVVARPALATAPFHELTESLQTTLRRARLVRKRARETGEPARQETP